MLSYMKIAIKRLVISIFNQWFANWHFIWLFLLACKYHSVTLWAWEFACGMALGAMG